METPAKIALPRRKKTSVKRHPWPLWFRHRKFTLVRGRDYAGMSHSMAQAVRNMAATARWRLRVSVQILEDPDRLEVEVVGRLGGR